MLFASEVVRVAVYMTPWPKVDGFIEEVTMMVTGRPPGMADAGLLEASVANGTTTTAARAIQMRRRCLRRTVIQHS
jgi:hypothetical protein